MPSDPSSAVPLPNPKIGAVSGGDTYLPTSGNGGYTVTGYDLDLDFVAQTERLEGTAILTAVATQKLSRFSLDLRGLVASKVSVNGTRVAKFSQADGKLSIRPSSPLPDGRAFTVMVQYGGFPHPTRSAASSPTSPASSSPAPESVGWTTFPGAVYVIGQPDGAPTWFPCNDRASEKAPVRIRMTCDGRLGAVATGALVSRQVRGNRSVWTYSTDEPVAPHQVGLSMGDFGAVPSPGFVQLHASAALVDAGLDSLNALARMQPVFEDAFGPFPLAAYAVLLTTDDLPHPLSAHGLSVFTAGAAAEPLLARTLARQWFGASVTAASWRDAWLHEAFALYASWMWEGADDCARAAWQHLSSAPQDFLVSDPGAHRIFDDRVATRGALALHAVRTSGSDDGFFALLRGWCEAHRLGSASTADFIDAAATTPALRALLHDWLEQEDLPQLPHRG